MRVERQLETYATWLAQEGLPIHTGHFVEDIRSLSLGPWKRIGGRGAYVQLSGGEDLTGVYLCEVPPRTALEPEVHLFEAVIYGLEGHCSTEFWRTGERRQTVEWQRNSLLALPLNVWHRFVNDSNDPALFMAVTNAPHIVNLFQNTNFVFGERYRFDDRYRADDDYFAADPLEAVNSYGEVVYENNFVPDMKALDLATPPAMASRGEGFQRRYLKLGLNRMKTFAAEYPVGTYTKGHWHGGGYHIYIAGGQAFTLMWPPEAGMRPWLEGKEDRVLRINFREGTVYAPPTGWWHQHFNTGEEPVRYVPTGTGFDRKSSAGVADALVSIREGGQQIDYDLEDPQIREIQSEEMKQAAAERAAMPRRANHGLIPAAVAPTGHDQRHGTPRS